MFGPTKKPGSRFLVISTVLLSMAAVSFTAGCAASNKKMTEEQVSADSLSGRAMESYNHGKYSTALDLFKEIQNRFPFSKYSLEAKLREADCHFFEDHYTEAISAYQKFAQDHPSHESMPYVLFRTGMSYARQMDTVDRDPKAAEMAEDAFKNLISRYPDSPYTGEARKQIKRARNFLALHELYVANFYLKTKKYKQAESRLEYLTDNYPDTRPAPEAREVLADIRAGNPPKGSWLGWIPRIGMQDPCVFDSLSAGL